MKREIYLIVAAMSEEKDAIIDKLKQQKTDLIEEEDGVSFKKNGKSYLVVRGKIGKVHTAFMLGKLHQKYDIKHIYNTGTAGTIARDVKILDVVVATGVAYHDVDVTGFDYPYGQLPECPLIFETIAPKLEERKRENYQIHYGLILSGDSFITKNNITKRMLESNALAIEMESGSVAQCAYIMKVPCTIVRSISDKIGEEGNGKTFDDMLIRSAQNAVDVLFEII